MLRTGFGWRNLEGKRPLGRPIRRWKNNIKMYLQKVDCGMVQNKDKLGAFVNAVMNLVFPYNARNFLTS